jgi:amidase
VGLVSRTHIVPISHTQDTAGPMTRSVADAAVLLDALAGPDPKDAATADAALRKKEYAAALRPGALKGKKIGVLRFNAGFNPAVDAEFEKALAVLKAAGAELVDIQDLEGRREVGGKSYAVLLAELKVDLAAYLAQAAPAVKVKTLADVIAFNKATPAETALFDQDIFVQADATKGLDDADYKAALETARRLAGPEGIDRLLAQHGVSLLVSPTVGPAWLIDPVNGDQYSGGSASTLPAVAGYPHLTVPMGQVRGLPVGLSFIGPAWSEADLLAAGYDYERLSKARKAPTYAASVDELPDVAAAFRPAP